MLENDETFYLDLFSGSPRVLGVLDGFETQRVTIVDNERKNMYTRPGCSNN